MRKSIIAFVFGACLLPDAAFTLGLGEIEVNSALNQKLDADIALLSATPEDAEQLIVKLAPAAEFSRAGIDRPYLLNSLRFSTEQKNGQLFIKVTTPKPIREPFLNFLLELDWPKGHLLREYTILLDPPVYMGAEAAGSSVRPAAMQAPAQPASRPAEPQGGYRPAAASAPVSRQTQAAPTQRPVAQPPRAASPRPAIPAGSQRVQAGDTAWSLASEMRPDQSISVEQMMIAMLRSNPEVFINNNVNGLKRGYILRAPDYDTIAAIDRDQAVALVREQNALWREYQQALASGAPASALESSAAGASVTADSTTTGDARLNIVSAGTGKGAGGGKDPTQMSMEELRRELALASEQLETERVEKEELNARVAALQAQVEKMKSLLTIEDQSMAEMQAAAETGAATNEAAPDSAAAEPAAAEAEQPVTGEEAPGEEPMPLEAETDGQPADEMADAATAEGEQALFVDEQQQGEQQGEAAQQDMPAEQTAPAMQPTDVMDTMPADFVTPPKKDPIAQIMSNPLLMGGIGGGVLLILLLILFLVKRRKSAAEEAPAAAPQPVEDELEKVADMVEDEAVSDVVSDEAVEESMAEAAAEEEDFDAESTMVLSTEDTVVTQAEEAVEQPEEDRDDVIAEADVYLAYGIYQQAEELLENAINEHPDRDAYRVKLAETHYASKNADAFVEVARALKEKSGTDSKSWAKVVAMGKDLCPDNELFTASDMVDGVDLDELAPKVPEMDFDLEGEAGGAEETPDLDFSLDDEPLDLPETGSEDTAILELDETTSETSTAEEELEFDLSEAEAIAPEQESAEEEEFSLDIDASELDIEVKDEAGDKEAEDEIDFTAEFAEEAGADEKPDEEELEVDISSELEETIITEATEAEQAADELDMMLDEAETDSKGDDELDLDLGLDAEETTEPAEAETTEAEDEMLDLDDDALGDLDDVDEVATKLDLARAYLDMGDSEGTRSILDEVMAEGNDEQKKEAQELLDQLG